MYQDDLFSPSIPQRYAQWRELPGARKVLQKAHAIGAVFFARFQRKGIGVSQRYIEEMLRDWIRCGLLRGEAADGFAYNSHFTRPMVLELIDRHPDWKPMFQLREPTPRRKRKVIVITEDAPPTPTP